MISTRMAVVVMIPLWSLAVQGCRRPSESRMAIQVANTATTPEQARLWREAADQGLATGLLNLEQTDRPVQSPPSAGAANQAIPAQGGGGIPASVVSALQVLSTVGLENAEFSGPARVSDVDASGERLSLDLGAGKTITFQARAGGRALAVMRGDVVQVEYRARNERFYRRQILAVRAPDGSGIARITETGSAPLTVSVPLFQLVATQLSGQPPARVEVRVGPGASAVRRPMSAGEMVQVGGIMVGVMASRAITGPESKTVEGSPYAIELIAWSSR